MMDSERYKNFIAGIELSGKLLPNGKIQSDTSGDIIDGFPKEFRIYGNTFTLESVRVYEKDYIHAQYV